jgi:hypothetical protein
MSFAEISRMGLAVIATAACVAALANDGAPALRFQKDSLRQREWMLTPRGVTLFEGVAPQRARVIELPGWVWAAEAYACPPDLALGPKGEAVVSSNVAPSVWRIDPVTLTVTRHDLVLDAHADKDVGFTALAFSAERQAFFGLSEFGALWRIDPLLRRAQEVRLDTPVRRACALTVRNRLLCAHDGLRVWALHLAADQRSASIARAGHSAPGATCARPGAPW